MPTMKQMNVNHFLKLCQEYRDLYPRAAEPENKTRFVALSIAIHAAKGKVPKRLWPMASPPRTGEASR